MLKDIILREFNKSLSKTKDDKLNMILKDEIEIIKEIGDKHNDKTKR